MTTNGNLLTARDRHLSIHVWQPKKLEKTTAPTVTNNFIWFNDVHGCEKILLSNKMTNNFIDPDLGWWIFSQRSQCWRRQIRTTITLNKRIPFPSYCVGNIYNPSTKTTSHLVGKNSPPTSLNSIESSNVIMNVNTVVFFITESCPPFSVSGFSFSFYRQYI